MRSSFLKSMIICTENNFKKSTNGPTHTQPCLLVVDDDEDMQAYIGSFLGSTYHILNASNGQEALSMLHCHSIDLVISDISMPIMDGFELLRRLRQEQNNLTPFLFLTAHSEKNGVMQALLLGVDAYVTKPFESDELMARVMSLLINNQRRKEAYAAAVSKSGDPSEVNLDLEEHASFRSKWLKELEEILHQEIGNFNIRIPDLAYKMAVSERTFRNRIKLFTGLSPHEYVMGVRMAKALQLLERGSYLTVAEVAHAVGMETTSYFTKNFKERFGKAPSEYL